MLIYAAIAVFGFLLLLVMLVAGEVFGGDHDIGAHEIAVEHGDFEHAGGPSVFSLRIMSSFLTAFGVGGVIARYYNLSHPASSGVGVVAGIVMSTAVYQFARILYSQQASSEVHMATLVGKTAEVLVAIPAGGVGQVMLTMGGERTDQIARAADGRPLARGTEVVITAIRGDSVVVAPVQSGAPGGAK